MKNILKKAHAALTFPKVTYDVLKVFSVERANRFMLAKTNRVAPLTLPAGIVIRCTERCFLKCKMCGQNGLSGRLKGTDASERMRVPDVVYERLAEEIPTWPIKPMVKVTGGEPLLEWNVLRPFFTTLSKAGCCIKLNSNGMLLKSKKLAEEVVKAGVHYLSVSIDGDEATHNAIRGYHNAYQVTQKGIANVLEARKKYNSPYPMILLSCVLSTENQDKLPEMSRVAKEMGADWLNLQFLNYLTPQRTLAAHNIAKSKFGIEEKPWEGFEIPDLTKIDCDLMSRNLEKVKKEAPCPVSVMKIGGTDPKSLHRFHYTDDIIKNHICHMPFTYAFIVPQGKSVFCIDYPYYFYGDLRKEKLSEAWQGEKATKFREQYVKHFKENGKVFPMCIRCNWPYNS